MDDSYIDKAIYRLFLVDVMQQIKVKAAISKQFHIPPSEIDRMPYWEYELWMKEINDAVKEENEAQQEQLDKYKIDETMASIRSGKMTKNAMPSKIPGMPKMPDFGTAKMRI